MMTLTHALQVELTKATVASMLEDLDDKKTIFSDKRYLESLSLPGFIIGRHREVKKLLELIYPQKTDYLVPFVSVIGSSGTGKTTIAKLVCEGILEYISYSFVNLRKARTIFGFTNLILSELGESPIKSYEGINNAVDTIEKRIELILQRDKKKHFVLVLDEFDTIFSDTRNNPSDFVYKLLTISENLRDKGLWLCIVTISNSDLSNYSLDDRIKSRIDNYEVVFPPYKEGEILRILRDRAKKAFAVKISEDVLKKCAQISADENGDCRRALELLRMAGDLVKGNELKISHVEEAAKELDKEKYIEVIDNATAHQKLLLTALAKRALYTEKEEHSTSDIYQEYSSLCGHNKIRSLSYRRAFDLLHELQNTGIIASRTQSNGRRGYHNFFHLTVRFELVGDRIDRDWWGEQRDEKARADKFQEEAIEKYKLAKKYSRAR